MIDFAIFLLLALLAGVIIVLAAILMLIIRQVLVILLVIIAPLAFAMAILPNTKSLFTKWWSMFKAMLLIYPIIGLVFGASKIGQNIFAGLAATPGAPPTTQWKYLIAGLVASVLPFVAVPILMKGMFKAFGSAGAFVSGAVMGRGMKLAGSSAKRGRTHLGGTAGGLTKRVMRSKLGTKVGNTGFGRSRFGRYLGAQASSRAYNASNKVNMLSRQPELDAAKAKEDAQKLSDADLKNGAGKFNSKGTLGTPDLRAKALNDPAVFSSLNEETQNSVMQEALPGLSMERHQALLKEYKGDKRIVRKVADSMKDKGYVGNGDYAKLQRDIESGSFAQGVTHEYNDDGTVKTNTSGDAITHDLNTYADGLTDTWAGKVSDKTAGKFDAKDAQFAIDSGHGKTLADSVNKNVHDQGLAQMGSGEQEMVHRLQAQSRAGSPTVTAAGASSNPTLQTAFAATKPVQVGATAPATSDEVRIAHTAMDDIERHAQLTQTKADAWNRLDKATAPGTMASPAEIDQINAAHNLAEHNLSQHEAVMNQPDRYITPPTPPTP